jgi:PKD repeat protein
MRHRSFAIVSSVVLASALVLGSQILVGRTASAAASDVVGSWLLSLTDPSAPADQPPVPGLATFFADGAFMAADLPVRAVPTPAAPAEGSPAPSPSSLDTGVPSVLVYSSAGHGVWTTTGSGRAALTFVELTTDAAGAFLATVTVSATVKLDDTGDVLSGPYSVSSVGPDGQPVGDSSGTLEGTRITIALIADFTDSQDPGTLDVAFLDKSTGDPTSWTWDFGDGHTSTRQSPTHTYATAGDYTVTLSVGAGGDSGAKSKTVSVAAVAAPKADFSSSQEDGTLGLHFTDSSTGDPTSWSWDFGDGSNANRQNPAHTYRKAGDYQVKLTVRNAGGSDSKTTKVTVKPVPAPVADFTVSQVKGELDVHFTDSSTGAPTSWSWDFGDGTNGTRQNPTHTYTQPGDYVVKLTVKNPGGADSKTRTVTVQPANSPGPS